MNNPLRSAAPAAHAGAPAEPVSRPARFYDPPPKELKTMKPKKHLAPWLKRDLRLMRSLARRRLSARQAAPLLGRTVAAVKWMAMARGVSFRAINQKPVKGGTISNNGSRFTCAACKTKRQPNTGRSR